MILLASTMIWLAPACTASEPRTPCPPLTAAQAALEAHNELNPDYDIGRDSGQAIGIAAFNDLCWREPLTVVCAGGGAGKLTATRVREIDTRLRGSFQYRSDIVNFDQADVWAAQTLCGDCEDYALTLSERLHKAGQGGENMGLVLWFSPRGAHATLVVTTVDAGMVEVSVGEAPEEIDWTKGVRVAVLWMDGNRRWSAPPGWPAPIVEDNSVRAPGAGK